MKTKRTAEHTPNALLYVTTLLLCLWATLAKAKGVIHIRADSITYDHSLHTYFASGHCTVYDSTYTIKADKMSINTVTTVATLRGHVEITDRTGNWIRGTYGVINLTTYKGFMDHVIMFNRIKQLYVKAQKIMMNGKNRYYLQSASFSGCACKECLENKPGVYPKWSIEAKHTYIVRNDYLFAYPAIFRIRKTPVAALPAFEMGLNNKRRSGLLMPSIGYSSSNGVSYYQPLYWAISNSQDLTFTPYTLTHRGNGAKIQYRFYWTKDITGNWNMDIFRETKPYISGSSVKTRINIKAWERFYLHRYGLINYNINLLNNRNNLRVLNNDNLVLSGNRYTVSTASYTKTWPHYTLSMSGYYYQDLTAPNNNYTVQKLPQINFNINNRELYHNLTLDMSNRLTYYYTVSDTRGVELRNYPVISYPLSLHHINLVPKIGIHHIYVNWWSPNGGKTTQKSVLVPECNLSFSTSLFKIYNFTHSDIKALKHTITPTLSYTYIPRIDQSSFPSFISTIHRENLIMLTLENTFDVKYSSNNKIYKRTILYNKISQGYDFTRSNYIPNYSTPPSSNTFPPLYEETTIYPMRHVSVSSKAHISTRYGKILDSTESLNLNFPSYGGSLGYITIRNPSTLTYSTRSLSLGVYMYPIHNLYLAFSTERDILGNYYPSKTYTIDYKEDCWAAGISVFDSVVSQEQSDGSYKRKRNVGFWITISLKGIGTLNRKY